MTDKPRPPPDDRELEQYLQGDSKLSRRYREASGETPPPELDEAILAQARRELRRRPHRLHRWLASVALAASVVLGINLGWNVYQVAPAPGETPQLKDAVEREPPASAPQTIAPAAPPPEPLVVPPERREQRSVPPSTVDAPAEDDPAAARGEAALAERRRAEAESARKSEDAAPRALAAEQQRVMEKQAAAPSRGDELAGAAPPAPAPMTESQKIDRLIAYVGGLDNVVFIRNGGEHSAADAARHMRLKREKAGDGVRTADEFILLCASFSSTTGEAYLMRFPDGRTRTAEDVLREQLATMP